MWRWLTPLFFGVSFAVTAQTPPEIDSRTDAAKPIPAELQTLHDQWAAEKDAKKRSELSEQIFEFIIHHRFDYESEQADQSGDSPLNKLADEVSRNGKTANVLKLPVKPRDVTLVEVAKLDGAQYHRNRWDGDPTPTVFRRIGDDRIEAWTSKRGWLFDRHGKQLVQVDVPRRDGTGREWFGAFLPDGRWITTDLWNEDKQVNAFSPEGKWLWEVKGQAVLAKIPASNNVYSERPKPLIDWARADKTGEHWLVCVGENYLRSCALLGPDGTITPLPETASFWSVVQPRSMRVRGDYLHLFIDSDDGKIALFHDSAGHGPSVGWPTYGLSGGARDEIIRDGNREFGFWPGSSAFFVGRGAAYSRWQTWFMDAQGNYDGETEGRYFADAANGRDVLVQRNGDDVVDTVQRKVLTISESRRFVWADGRQAFPLAIYDNLKLGFFSRGNPDGDPAKMPGADVVLARWD